MTDRCNNILTVQCCYCRVYFATKDAQGAPGGVSHGICPACFDKVSWEWEEKLNHQKRSKNHGNLH